MRLVGEGGGGLRSSIYYSVLFCLASTFFKINEAGTEEEI